MAVIYKPKHAVILRLRDPRKVTSVIPRAKRFVDKGTGKEYVAVPHFPEETIKLRQLGFKGIPDPMETYYEYPGKFKPFEAQRLTAQFASMNRRCFILNSMGLGKTITSLWAMDYLRSIKQVHRVLVVCPISVMERAWADEVFRSFPDYKVNVLYGTAAKRKKLLDDPADIYIVNTDGQKIIADDLAKRDDIDLVIIDELALFRNSHAERWKTMNEICNKQCGGKRRVWGLTGSPIPNSPEDAYGQMKLVNPENPEVPKYFARWRDRVMYKVDLYNWKPKESAIDSVHRAMSPAVRFSLDDAVDLPPQVIQTRQVSMTAEQKKAFKQMMNSLFMECKDGKVTAVNEAVKASKLLQICCGVAYDEHHKELCVGASSRLDALEEVVCESEGKVIVFCPYTSALNNVKEFLEKKGHTVAVVQGDVSKSERDSIFFDFQNRTDPQVLVANPSTMSHGLTLTAATTIVWYGPTYNNEIYMQACARVRRPGQKRTTVIVHFVSSGFEDRIYKRLDGKQTTQGILLQMMKENDLTVY